MLRRHRQRPSKRHRCSGRRQRGGYARPRDRSAPGSGTQHPCWGRRRRAASPGPRARSQAGGGVPDGAAAPRLHGWRSLRARRTRAGAGQTGPRPHQRQLQRPDTPPRASQKLITAATLLRAMPAPSTPEARNLHREVQALIDQAVVQQAESSASRIRQQGDARGDRATQGGEPSVHAGEAAETANPRRTPAKERLLDTRRAMDGDARNVINARRTSKADARAAAG
jgi:hypothetical protein